MVPHVRKQIPEAHEQQEPSDQTKKPDDDIGLPVAIAALPPGVTTPLMQKVCVDLSQGAKSLWNVKKRGTIPSNCEGQSYC